MLINITPIAFSCLIFLLYFSYLDIKYHRLHNSLILAFFLVGLILYLQNGNILTLTLGITLMTILSVCLWLPKSIGGADAKLLIGIVPWLGFVGLANMLVILTFFLIIFGILGTTYGLFWKLQKYDKEIPFIPIITLSYFIIIFMRIQ